MKTKFILLSFLMYLIISIPIYGAETWSSGNIAAKTYTTNETINLTGNVTLNGKITINTGATLKLEGNGKITRGTSYTGALFEINTGGTLLISGGTGEKNDIIIDGNENVIAQASAIISKGILKIENATIQNNKNRASKSSGGAIYSYASGNVELTNCLITKNTACAFGGAIYSASNLKITNTEISYNRAMTTATETVTGLRKRRRLFING